MSTPFDRVFEATGCTTQIELAEFLGISSSSISDAKRRNAIPADWLVILLRATGVNPDWIMKGRGAKMLEPAGYAEAIAPPPVYIREVRPPKECSMEELMAEIVRRVMEGVRLVR